MNILDHSKKLPCAQSSSQPFQTDGIKTSVNVCVDNFNNNHIKTDSSGPNRLIDKSELALAISKTKSVKEITNMSIEIPSNEYNVDINKNIKEVVPTVKHELPALSNPPVKDFETQLSKKVSTLQNILTDFKCKLCKGYFVDATSIIVCLHTCKYITSK